ncbi:unnamed protein product [Linum tenue]|uniref:Uncharacterized protein n=1 Tax=Linum tenue TaxID=586396 RepID=A0AAV0NKR2_9ROSI|nr:unnamed protein product [Linum tenue]
MRALSAAGKWIPT